jgi:tape measure domain-containing protein
MATKDLNVILGLRIENFQKNLSKAQRSMNKFGRDMERLGSNLTQALTLPILGAGGAAVASAVEFEQLEARLRVLTGSAEAGAAVFERIKKFAASTPFEVTDLVKATSQLIAFGFSADEALDSLQYLGDIAAATGSNINEIALILGQARTVGVAFTQDLRQLASRGIPVFEMLQEQTGLTGKAFDKFVSDGGVTFEVLNGILRKTASEGGKFFNGMGEQSRTLGGRISNFKDAAKNAFAELGKSIIESTNLGERIQQLTNLIDALVERFNELSPEAKRTAINIALIVSAIGPATFVIGKFATVIGGLAKSMGSLFKMIIGLAGPTGIIIGVVALVGAMYYEFENVRKVVNGLLKTFVAFGTLMLQLGKQLFNFTSLLGAIKSGNIENIRTSFNKLKNDLTDLPTIVSDAFKEINFTDSENKIESFIDRAKKAIFGVKQEAANVVIPGSEPTTTVTGGGGGGDAFTGSIDKSQAYATALLPNFEGATEQLRTYNTELEKSSSITDRVNATFDILSSSITPIIDGVFNALESGQNVFKALVRGVKDLIVNLIKAVAQAAILSAIMNILFPGLGAAGGAFSFRKILGGSLGIPGLASGGLITGPTMALVGEGSGTSISNPEVVAPLDKLRSMLSGTVNNNGFVASTKLQGSDLLLVVERAERNRNR